MLSGGGKGGRGARAPIGLKGQVRRERRSQKARAVEMETEGRRCWECRTTKTVGSSAEGDQGPCFGSSGGSAGCRGRGQGPRAKTLCPQAWVPAGAPARRLQKFNTPPLSAFRLAGYSRRRVLLQVCSMYRRSLKMSRRLQRALPDFRPADGRARQQRNQQPHLVHQTTPPPLRRLLLGLAVIVTSLSASDAGPLTLAYGIGWDADWR